MRNEASRSINVFYNAYSRLLFSTRISKIRRDLSFFSTDLRNILAESINAPADLAISSFDDDVVVKVEFFAVIFSVVVVVVVDLESDFDSETMAKISFYTL